MRFKGEDELRRENGDPIPVHTKQEVTKNFSRLLEENIHWFEKHLMSPESPSQVQSKFHSRSFFKQKSRLQTKILILDSE